MAICYKRLFKKLIDKNMNKTDLHKMTGISWGVIAKLSRNEKISMEPLIKICKALDCTIDDILEILPDEVERCD